MTPVEFREDMLSVEPSHSYKGERLTLGGHCYCGKKARRTAKVAGCQVLVCGAWCAQRLPARMAQLEAK